MKDSERVARRIFEILRPGIRAESVTMQSHGEHDFDLVDCAGELLGIMEVTSATDFRVRRTDAAIERDPVIKLSRARHRWYVTPMVDFNEKRVRNQIDAFLFLLEEKRITHFSRSHSIESVASICQQLTLEYGVMTPTAAAEVVLGFPGAGCWVTSEDTAAAVEVEANKDDNRRKLAGRPNARERHLFVVIDDRNHGPWIGLSEEPPARVPTLPETVTHVWVAGPAVDINGWYIVWRAGHGESFQEFAHVRID